MNGRVGEQGDGRGGYLLGLIAAALSGGLLGAVLVLAIGGAL